MIRRATRSRLAIQFVGGELARADHLRLELLIATSQHCVGVGSSRALSQTFSDEAGVVEGAQESGDDDERAPSWKQRAEKRARGHRPRHGKGFGHRRDSD